MSSLTSKVLLNKLRNHKTNNKDGFTLIELLIVVIIVGVLSAVALPAFVGQAAKAKIASAKALASTAAKECQTYLVGDQLEDFVLTTKGGGDILFSNAIDIVTQITEVQGSDPIETTVTGADTCTLANGGTFIASIPKGKDTSGNDLFDHFAATVEGGSGAVAKACAIAAEGTKGDVKDGCTLSISTTNGTW